MKKVRVLSVVMVFLLMGSLQFLVSCSPSPTDVLEDLQEGNERYVEEDMEYPNQNQSRRNETATEGQHPYATVITCSDSRVPPELIFDAGIGDLFVIRVAGNVMDVDEIGSVEYGIDHLGTPVLVVLGHTNCGAVTAVATNAEVHGSIPALVDNIIPAVARAKEKNADLAKGALIAEAIKENVWVSIEDLFKSSSAARVRVKMGKLRVVGAVYDIATGTIEWLGIHPNQSKLIITTQSESKEAHGEPKSTHKPESKETHAQPKSADTEKAHKD